MEAKREKKDKALNLRVSESQRAAYERAAVLEGQSMASLVLAAADERARAVLRSHSSTVVPADVFDQLLARLDEPARPLAPSLAKAMEELPQLVERR